MTANRYRRPAQILAVPTSVAWGVLYAVIAAYAIVYWTRFNIAYLHRVPNIEMMKGAAIASELFIAGYAYTVFMPWWQGYLESWQQTLLGWDTRL